VENAHPHFDTTGDVHVVVNGIVENFAILRERLIAGGARFTSETDAEVIAHLIASKSGDLLEAVTAAVAELEGHYAFVAMSADEPGLLIAYRKEYTRVIAAGEGELFVGSAIPAFLRYTRQAISIEYGESVELRASGVTIRDGGEIITREPETVDRDEETAEK